MGILDPHNPLNYSYHKDSPYYIKTGLSHGFVEKKSLGKESTIPFTQKEKKLFKFGLMAFVALFVILSLIKSMAFALPVLAALISSFLLFVLMPYFLMRDFKSQNKNHNLQNKVIMNKN